MTMLKRLQLHSRLLMSFALIGLVPLIFIGLFSLFYAQKILFSQLKKDLVSICDAKSISIKNFLSSHESNVKTLAASGGIVDAVETLEEAFDEMGGTTEDNMLWQALYHRYYPWLTQYTNEQEYMDLYLISTDGDIVFSVTRKNDLGKNIMDESLRNTSLAFCYKKALQRVFLSDFALYPPHDNEPAAFAGAPIYRDGEVSGVVALYISIDMINRIMLRRSGLGGAGETYLVGEDFLLRSDAYHSPEYTVKGSFENPDKRKLQNSATLQSFMGFTGCITATNYVGQKVIRAFSPVVISEMTWAVIADLNHKEAFEPIRVFKMIIIIAVGIGMMIVLFLSLFISGKISGPIKRLTEATENMKAGRYDIRIDNDLTQSSDEVGILARSFDQMTRELDQTMQDLVSEIREKEIAHEALRDKEERLQSILNNTTSMVFLKDLENRIIMANPQYKKVFGYKGDDLIGKTDSDLFSREVADRFIENDRKVLEADGPIQFEEKVNMPDGIHTYLTVKFPIHDKDGRPYAVCGIATDITELKRKEQAISDALSFNEKIISESPVGMVIYDENGDCIEINKSMCALIGAEKEAALAQNYHRIENWKEGGLYDLVSLAIARDQHQMMEFHSTTSFGKDVWLRTFLMPFKVSGKTHLLVMGIDISQTMQAQKEKERMEGQLRQAHKMEAIGTLAGGIAHDFNNILSAILGYSQMARYELPEEDPVRGRLEKVIQAGDRAKELVRQILSFSRKSDQDRIPVRIHFILEEVVKLLRATIPATIRIETDIDPDCGFILADSTQIHQVVMNLCTNAFQSMEEDDSGVLSLSLNGVEMTKKDLENMAGYDAGPYVELKIADTGMGIPKENLDRIFDPYFTTKDIGKGSGMGLAVVHGIVKSHDGMLFVHSEPESGSEFRILFPRTDPVKQERVVRSQEVKKGNEHVLVVDDEDSLVEIAKIRLESMGYQVTGVTSSPEALEMFKQDPGRFDILVTDQTMPQMTGKQLANEIFSLREAFPVILCSGYSDKINEAIAEESGISAFIMKPVEMDELSRVIRQVLDADP